MVRCLKQCVLLSKELAIPKQTLGRDWHFPYFLEVLVEACQQACFVSRKRKASRGCLRIPGAPTPFLRQRETIFDGGSISKLFSPRAVILSAATAVRGTLRRPTLWMGVPPLHAGSRSSHHYNRCLGFVRSLRSAGSAPAGRHRSVKAVSAQLQIEPLHIFIAIEIIFHLLLECLP